jgi:hypothetical protein
MALRFVRLVLATWLAVGLAACGAAAPVQPAGVVVTLHVADAEEYRIKLTEPDDIAIAQKLLAGEDAPRIPNGRVRRGAPDVNVGYSWHIDPATIEFADTTTEVCDGRPSDVEKGAITSDQFCPWSAKVVAIVPSDDRR